MDTLGRVVIAPERVDAAPPLGHEPDTATHEAQRAAALLRDVHPDSPCRSPSWRWQLAQILRDQAHPWLRRLADDPVHQVVAFLKKRDHSACQPERDDRDETMADLTAACALSHEHPPRRRCEVEARVLANEPIAEIARKCALTVEGVSWYEAVFFDVRGCLDRPSYILHSVIGSGLLPSADFLPPERLWRWLGYRGGPHVVDALVTAGRINSSTGAGDCELTPAAAHNARLLDWLADIQAIPVNAQTARSLIALGARVQEIQKQERDRSLISVSGPITTASDETLALLSAPAELTAQVVGQSGQRLVDQPGTTIDPDDDWSGAKVVILFPSSALEGAPTGAVGCNVGTRFASA